MPKSIPGVVVQLDLREVQKLLTGLSINNIKDYFVFYYKIN